MGDRGEGRKERVPVRDDFLLDCSKGFTEPLLTGFHQPHPAILKSGFMLTASKFTLSPLPFPVLCSYFSFLFIVNIYSIASLVLYLGSHHNATKPTKQGTFEAAAGTDAVSRLPDFAQQNSRDSSYARTPSPITRIVCTLTCAGRFVL